VTKGKVELVGRSARISWTNFPAPFGTIVGI
jgi:hypothetical protein